MANNYLTQQLTVDFAPGTAGAQLIWEDDDREPEDHRIQYVRLYPAVVPVVFTTSGSLSYKGKRTERNKTEILTFSGEKTVSGPYPEIYNVTVKRIGGFYDKTGTIVPDVVFTYNTKDNVLESTHEGFGIAEIEFDVDYRFYRFRFSGPGCPEDTFEPLPEDYEPYKEAMLVAIDGAKEAIATHSPSPPSCDEKNYNVNFQPGAIIPRIDLIIDPEYPPSMGKDIGVSIPIDAGCRIRHIPDIASNVKTNSGKIVELSLDGGPLYQNVSEMLVFSGSSSVNLQYQAHRAPEVFKQGTYRNRWGERVTPQFVGAGATVKEVERPSANVKRNPRRRVVGDDEVVAVDEWYNTLEVYGIIEVEYYYSYRVFEMAFGYDNEQSIFLQSHVTAFHDTVDPEDTDEAATLIVNPPSLKGTT